MSDWPTDPVSRRVLLAADVTNDNAVANTIADVTGLSFPVAVSKRYWFRFSIEFTAPAPGTTGSRWAISGPASPTRMAYLARWTSGVAAETSRVNDAYDGGTVGTASNNGVNFATVEGIILVGATAGTIIARFASEIASSAIIAKAGSFVEYIELV